MNLFSVAAIRVMLWAVRRKLEGSFRPMGGANRQL
jgi:hypothetical protein